jgi:hypothetical protein
MTGNFPWNQVNIPLFAAFFVIGLCFRQCRQWFAEACVVRFDAAPVLADVLAALPAVAHLTDRTIEEAEVALHF